MAHEAEQEEGNGALGWMLVSSLASVQELEKRCWDPWNHASDTLSGMLSLMAGGSAELEQSPNPCRGWGTSLALCLVKPALVLLLFLLPCTPGARWVNELYVSKAFAS